MGDLIANLVPSVEHHALALHLAYFLLDAVNPKVGKHSYFLVGCATFRGPDSAKQGDWGFRPLPERTFRGDWPTLVMEVGVHESLERLRDDAEWWLVNSKGAVKVVLLIAYLGKERFTIEKWKMGTVPAGAGATDIPEMVSSTSISRQEDSDHYVASDDLNLRFEDLFLTRHHLRETLLS